MASFNGPRPLYRWQLGFLLLSLPRRLIPARGARGASQSSPSPLFSSRRAAATSTSRNQSDRSPEPLRRTACSAASRMRASCSGRRRTRMEDECLRDSSIFGLGMSRRLSPMGLQIKRRISLQVLAFSSHWDYNYSRFKRRHDLPFRNFRRSELPLLRRPDDWLGKGSGR
jgi:hypothetical protein